MTKMEITRHAVEQPIGYLITSLEGHDEVTVAEYEDAIALDARRFVIADEQYYMFGDYWAHMRLLAFLPYEPALYEAVQAAPADVRDFLWCAIAFVAIGHKLHHLQRVQKELADLQRRLRFVGDVAAPRASRIIQGALDAVAAMAKKADEKKTWLAMVVHEKYDTLGDRVYYDALDAGGLHAAILSAEWSMRASEAFAALNRQLAAGAFEERPFLKYVVAIATTCAGF